MLEVRRTDPGRRGGAEPAERRGGPLVMSFKVSPLPDDRCSTDDTVDHVLAQSQTGPGASEPKRDSHAPLLIEHHSATAQSIELMLKSEGFNVYTRDRSEEDVDLGKPYDYGCAWATRTPSSSTCMAKTIVRGANATLRHRRARLMRTQHSQTQLETEGKNVWRRSQWSAAAAGGRFRFQYGQHSFAPTLPRRRGSDSRSGDPLGHDWPRHRRAGRPRRHFPILNACSRTYGGCDPSAGHAALTPIWATHIVRVDVAAAAKRLPGSATEPPLPSGKTPWTRATSF